MTQEEHFALVFKHRMRIISILYNEGYDGALDIETMNIHFCEDNSPSSDLFDAAMIKAFLIIRDQEEAKGNEIEIEDLIWR